MQGTNHGDPELTGTSVPEQFRETCMSKHGYTPGKISFSLNGQGEYNSIYENLNTQMMRQYQLLLPLCGHGRA
jgi:hypothetical protein